RGHALRVLGAVARVVVGALDVQRDEEEAARRPAHVLAVLAGLALDRERHGAEVFAPRLESRQRVLAVDPLVVAGNQDERVANARELRFPGLERLVVAGIAA